MAHPRITMLVIYINFSFSLLQNWWFSTNSLLLSRHFYGNMSIILVIKKKHHIAMVSQYHRKSQSYFLRQWMFICWTGDKLDQQFWCGSVSGCRSRISYSLFFLHLVFQHFPNFPREYWILGDTWALAEYELHNVGDHVRHWASCAASLCVWQDTGSYIP